MSVALQLTKFRSRSKIIIPLKKSQQLMILAHLIGWAIFWTLPLVLYSKSGYYEFEEFAPTYSQIFAKYIPLNTCVVLFFYFNCYFLIPKFINKKRPLVYICSIINCFNVTFLIVRFLAPTPDASLPEYIRDSTRVPTMYIFFVLIFIFLLSCAIRITKEYIDLERRSKDIEAAKVNSELLFLKAQVNPHFLFNTLNSIYSLSLSKSDLAPDAVLKLSNLMRYVSQETKMDYMPLDRCVEYVKHYIELQRLRLSQRNKLNITFEGDFASREIAPLIMLPFVENAFKYGVTNHYESEIRVSITLEGDMLYFYTCNPIYKDNFTETHTGIGIENIKRRLNLIYPGRHNLKITNANDQFEVKLNIELA